MKLRYVILICVAGLLLASSLYSTECVCGKKSSTKERDAEMEHTQVIALCRALLASVDKPSAGLDLWNEEAEECAQQLRAALSPATAAALRVAAVEMLHTVDAKSYERGKAAGSEPWEKLCRWTLGSESDVIVALDGRAPAVGGPCPLRERARPGWCPRHSRRGEPVRGLRWAGL
jgi:hypothetical protein